MNTVRLKIGDHVRVSDTVASEYAGASGVIVAIEDRNAGMITLSSWCSTPVGVIEKNTRCRYMPW